MPSRIEICEKYRLHPLTFDAILGFLSGQPVEDHGSVIYTLTPKDDFVLKCARLHPASYVLSHHGNARLYPFHRFLLLKFLTVGFPELMADIRQRSLAPGIEESALRYMEKQVYALLPVSMRELAKKRQAPPKELENDYLLMLKVLGIDFPYGNPTWLDMFFEYIGDPEQKVLFESIMTTKGCVVDWQDAMVALSETKWEPMPLNLYASLFYDRGHLSKLDWDHYLMLLAPTERNAKRLALTMTTSDLCVKHSENTEFQKTIKTALVSLQRKIYEALQMRGADARQLQLLLVSYNTVGKASGEVAETTGVRIGYFQGITVEPVDHPFTVIDDNADRHQDQIGA